jgi:signal transduction histidine kinase/ligand-binding sensor domain-containing protein
LSLPKQVVFFLLLIISVKTTAQPRVLEDLRKIQPSEKYVLTNWTSNSGLPQNSVNKICQDKNGIIWIATYGGLVRFDGSRFKTFAYKNYPELYSDRMVSVFADSKNNVWLSNEQGRIIVFNGRSFKDISSKFSGSTTIAHNFAEDSKGNIYIEVDSSLFYYSNGKAETVKFLVNKKLVSKLLLYDACPVLYNDTLIVSHDNSLSFIYNGMFVKTVHINKPSALNHSIIINKSGCWFVNDNKLYFAKNSSNIPRANNIFPKIKFSRLYSLGSKLLAATVNQGIYLINDNSTIEQLYNQSQISSSLRTTLFIDSDKNFWVGTELNGLYYIKRKFLYTLNKSFGLSVTNTYPIFKSSDGSIWIGHNPGLTKLENNGHNHFSKKQFPSFPVVWGLAEDKDKSIWMATNGTGLMRLKHNAVENFTPQVIKKAGFNFFSIYNDSKNRMWMGSLGCITKYENGKFSFFFPFDDRRNIYRNILEDKQGVMWFASDKGLIKYSNEKFTLIDSLNATSARALYIDRKNRLWVGTYGNGLRIKVGNKFFKMRLGNGLFSDIISAVVEDYKGSYWFTCNNGIFRIRETDIDNYLSGKTKSVTSINYGNDEGLDNIEFNGGCQPSWMRDFEGNLWFPSFCGAVVVAVDEMRHSISKPSVKIDNLVYKDRTYYPGDKISLPSDYTSFTINIVAPSFTSPTNVRFKYRLLGSSDEWLDASSRRLFTFQKLPYGDYEFQILASDGYGNWSTKPASIKFTVESRFTETPYFYILLTLIVSSIFVLFLFMRLKLAEKNQAKLELIVEERTRSMKEAKEEAEKAAREEKVLRAKAEEENRQKLELLRIVSHDLKNPISAISGFTEMLIEDGQLNEENKNIVEMVQDASSGMIELITQLLNFSRFEGDGFQVLKSNILVKQEVDKVIERLRNQASKKQQTITKDYRITGCKIFADNILFSQIIENLVCNAIKYSPLGKEIIVKIIENDEKVFIQVKDFGQGFSEKDKANLYKPFAKLSSTPTAGEVSSGLGLTIVKKFVLLNDGVINLESQKGIGSEFTIEFNKVNSTEQK